MTEKTLEQLKEEIKNNAMAEVVRLSERNPGAMTALCELLKNYSMAPLIQLDKMNIRGYKIWLVYKDVCDQNVDTFYAFIMRHDTNMQNYVNNYGKTENG